MGYMIIIIKLIYLNYIKELHQNSNFKNVARHHWQGGGGQNLRGGGRRVDRPQSAKNAILEGVVGEKRGSSTPDIFQN